MKTVRARILLLAAFTFAVIISFGFLTFSSFRNYTHLQTELSQSYELIDAAFQLQARTLANDQKEALVKMADSLSPESRATALKSFIKNSSTDNLSFLMKNETHYRNYIEPLISYYKKSLSYFAAISLASALLLTLALLIFVLSQVFAPLHELSGKMIDFLNNKYSYEFTVPEPNEIGQLRATFNNMAQKVLSQIEELKSLDKAKTEFLSIASHELRTPLTSIKGSLSLLNSGVAGSINEATKNLMSIALVETDRLIRLINELLDLAKIEARQFPLSCDWIAAHELTQKTFQSLRGFCDAAQVSLTALGGEEIDLFVDADRTQQVLTNLLSNAVKYSPPKSTVLVKYVVTETQDLRIEITDRGSGIAPEDQEIIFEKFRQATSPKNPLVKGTGLGLAIAKALVEQHGGAIGVRSLPGEGSTFYFTLPKWRPHMKNLNQAAS